MNRALPPRLDPGNLVPFSRWLGWTLGDSVNRAFDDGSEDCWRRRVGVEPTTGLLGPEPIEGPSASQGFAEGFFVASLALGG